MCSPGVSAFPARSVLFFDEEMDASDSMSYAQPGLLDDNQVDTMADLQRKGTRRKRPSTDAWQRREVRAVAGCLIKV